MDKNVGAKGNENWDVTSHRVLTQDGAEPPWPAALPLCAGWTL